MLPSGLARPRGKQDRGPLGPAVADAALLAGDSGFEFLVDGDECFPLHLVVLVEQIRSLAGIVDDAVERQAQRVPEAEPAADEDEGDQPPGRVVPPVKVGRVLELGHDVLGQGTGKQLPALGVVVVVEHGAGGQGLVPAEPPDRVQEAAELPDALGVDVAAGQLGVQAGQVASLVTFTAGEARNALKRAIARAPLVADPAPVPLLSRHRIHRLASSFSHGWEIWANRTVAGPSLTPRLRSRQASRGYSTSQPRPAWSSSTLRRA